MPAQPQYSRLLSPGLLAQGEFPGSYVLGACLQGLGEEPCQKRGMCTIPVELHGIRLCASQHMRYLDAEGPDADTVQLVEAVKNLFRSSRKHML